MGGGLEAPQGDPSVPPPGDLVYEPPPGALLAVDGATYRGTLRVSFASGRAF